MSTRTYRNRLRGAAFRLNPVAAACAVAFSVAVVGAYAQETPAAPAAPAAAPAAAPEEQALESITVSGMRAAIEKSVDAKRNSDSIIEAFSAEDIGKLPDVSIAETLSRLPGLAAQRVSGRAQVIAIRGMSPDFAGTLLNGREQTTTGPNRGVEFDQYPSELINGGDVYKTPNATLLGQGLSGTIDLHAIRPLEVSGHAIAANLRGEANSLGNLNNGYGDTSQNGQRFSLSYIDQFNDRTLGLALGYAHLNAPGQEQHYKAWWWGAPGSAWFNGAAGLGGMEAEAISRKELRDGFMGVLEYKPNKDLHSTLDLYYSTFDQTEVMRGFMYDSNPYCTAPQSYTCGAPLYVLTNPGFTGIGGTTALTSGTISFPATGNQPIVRNDFNKRFDNLASVGWNTQAQVADWKAIADLSYSSARRDESLFETYAGAQTSSVNFAVPVTYGFGNFSPNISYSDPNANPLGDPGRYGHNGRKAETIQDDILKDLNLHAKHDLGWIFSEVDAGVNYSRRDKTRNYGVQFAQLKSGTTQVVSPNLLLTPTSLAFVGVPGVLSYDVNAVAAQDYNMVRNMSGGYGGDYAKDFGVHERITTYYAKADIEHDLGPLTLRGNVGAQFIHTDQSSNAFAFGSANGPPIGTNTIGTTYNDFLPSLNLIGDFGGGRYLRFGLAKTLARPRIDDLNASSSADVGIDHLWSGGGGNPKLQPWRARSADLSLEQFFGKRSYVAAAGFFKKLDSYIYNQAIPFDFTGYVAPSGITALSPIGSLNGPTNGSGGNMSGVELSTSLDGGLLTSWLDGFGTQLSASFTNSTIRVFGPGNATPLFDTLPGLSRKVAQASIYYENDGYQVRFSDRYRSDYRGEYISLFGNNATLRNLSQNLLDFQSGYEIQTGRAKGLSFLFQILNLTNAPDRNLQDGAQFGGVSGPQETNYFGRAYLFGVNYKIN